MALTQTTRAYEILVRFNDDASVAVHKQDLLVVKNGGTVVIETPLPPQALDIAGLKQIVADI